MKSKHDLNTDYLREVLSYDPVSGSLQGTAEDVKVVVQGERLVVRLRRYKYVAMAERVIHALMTGRWPEGAMRHRNGDQMDLRWRNLAMT